jgi:hypothetical protein
LSERLFNPDGDAPPAPESRVLFAAGVLAQMTWGDAKRTPEQRKLSVEIARDALERLARG